MVSRVLLSLVLVLGVAAAALADEPIVIKMYGGYGLKTQQAQILDSYLRQYEQLHPGIKIEDLGRMANVDKLVNLFVTGEAPDIIENDAKFIANFYRAGMLAQVPTALQQRLEAKLFPASVSFLKLQGRMFGVPTENMVTGVWYSRSAMAAAGIGEVPESMEGMVALSKRLAKFDADGQVTLPGFVQGSGIWVLNHMALAVLTAEGGRVLDQDGHLVLDTPALDRTIDDLLRWMAPGTGVVLDKGFGGKFNEGEIAFSFGYPFLLFGIRNNYDGDYHDNFGVTTFKVNGNPGAFHYGHAYGVSADSKHQAEAWKLLEWLSLKQINGVTPIGHMLSAVGSLPNVREDILSQPYAADRAIYEGFVENLTYAINTPDWEKAAIGEEVEAVVKGESNPPEARGKVLVSAKNKLADNQKWLEEHTQ